MVKNAFWAAILFLGLAIHTNAQQISELDQALTALGTGSAQEMKRRLFTERITVFDDKWREQALITLPASQHKNRITKGKLFSRVEIIFHQTLQFHGRGGQIELFLFHDEIPTARLWRGCVLALSDGLADPLYDGELTGVMAHELGHSYFEDEMAATQRTQDAREMRVIELKCDAVAMLSLKLMSQEPTHYLRGLQRIQSLIKKRGLSRSIFQSHPELVVRAEFSQLFIKTMG
jgi:hypothetical protein